MGRTSFSRSPGRSRTALFFEEVVELKKSTP
jgi:hypothetical protein